MCHLWMPQEFFSLRSTFYSFIHLFIYWPVLLWHSPHSFCAFPASHPLQASCFPLASRALWLFAHICLHPLSGQPLSALSKSTHSSTCFLAYEPVDSLGVGAGLPSLPHTQEAHTHHTSHFPIILQLTPGTDHRDAGCYSSVWIYTERKWLSWSRMESGERKEHHMAPGYSVGMLWIHQTLEGRKADSPHPTREAYPEPPEREFLCSFSTPHFPSPLPWSRSTRQEHEH